MKGEFCDRPERNARPSDNNYDSGQAPDPDGIILNSKKNDFGSSSDSVFESSSCTITIDSQKSWFNRFFDLFGSGSEDSMCPAPVETTYASTDSPWMDKFCDLFDFLIPEDGGAYFCNDPSKMVPPSPFIGDIGNCD